MATIKVKFRSSAVDDHEGAIYYQIIHERRVRQLLSAYRVFPSEWDESRSMVSASEAHLLTVRDGIRRDVERLSRIDRRLDASGLPYTADDVIDEFCRYSREFTLSSFMEGIIEGFRANGRLRTAETYRAALNSFRRFRCDTGSTDEADVMLDCISPGLMEAYEAWLRGRKVASNTVSFYTRILRAVYNRAVERGVTDDRSPFKRVYTGIDKTAKRALPLRLIRRIKGLDLSGTPRLDFARDMFMMSFYLRGMSFIDMAYLRKADLRDGYVVYRRRKTGQRLVIKWTREMQSILDKYAGNESAYLLPVIRTAVTDERSVYLSTSYNINRSLKKIAALAGMSMPLTLYVARHSWASAARDKGIPLSVISEGMGHDSENTTRIYLSSIETSVVDKANSLILSSL